MFDSMHGFYFGIISAPLHTDNQSDFPDSVAATFSVFIFKL